MTTIRMHIEAASEVVTTLRSAATELSGFAADLAGPHRRALEMLDVGIAPSLSGGPIASLEHCDEMARAIATDLEWRIGELLSADHHATEAMQYDELPFRNLMLVSMTEAELLGLARSGDERATTLAVEEVAMRAAADPEVAVDFITGLGSDGVELVWTTLDVTNSPNSSGSNSMGYITFSALNVGGGPVIKIVENANISFHFAEEDHYLGALHDSFETFDAWSDGKVDGVVSTGDLEAVAASPSTLAPIAQWFLDRPDVLRGLDNGTENNDYMDGVGPEVGVTFGAGAGHDSKFDGDDVDDYIDKRNAAYVLFPLTAAIDTAYQNREGDEHAEADGVLSRDDYATAAEWEWISATQYGAIQQVCADEAWDHVGGSLGVVILDGVAFVPIIGDAVDGVRAAYYLSQGDVVSALEYGIGLMPVPGLSGGAIQAGRKTLKEIGEVVADETVEAATGAAGRVVARETADNVVTAAIADEFDPVVQATADAAAFLVEQTGNHHLANQVGRVTVATASSLTGAAVSSAGD